MADMDALEDLLRSADMGSFRKVMDSQPEEIPDTLDAGVYAECFRTTAGRLVLEDLLLRYAHVTRWVPGRDASEGYYREGAAMVIYDIADRIMKTERKDGT